MSEIQYDEEGDLVFFSNRRKISAVFVFFSRHKIASFLLYCYMLLVFSCFFMKYKVFPYELFDSIGSLFIVFIFLSMSIFAVIIVLFSMLSSIVLIVNQFVVRKLILKLDSSIIISNLCIFFAINLTVSIFMYCVAYKSAMVHELNAILLISFYFYIVAMILYILYIKRIHAYAIFAIIFMLFFFLPLLHYDYTSKFVEFGLRRFGITGEKIEFVDMDDKVESCNLVFLSPTKIYYYKKEQCPDVRGLSVISVDKIKSLWYLAEPKKNEAK